MRNFKKLSREKLKNLNGGKLYGGSCAIKVTVNGVTEVHNQYFGGTTNQQVSDSANVACVKALQNANVTRCQYDCAYDGYGN